MASATLKTFGNETSDLVTLFVNAVNDFFHVAGIKLAHVMTRMILVSVLSAIHVRNWSYMSMRWTSFPTRFIEFVVKIMS